MIIGVPKEKGVAENRVALVPSEVKRFVSLGHKVFIEKSAGLNAGYTDDEYNSAGAEIVEDRRELFLQSDIVLQVRCYGADPEAGKEDLAYYREGQVIVGFWEPLWRADLLKDVVDKGIVVVSVELIPRISRAQSMDALSSQANIVGYKAVIVAAGMLPRLFPMMMTAAGTISPARVFVVGAGVAGLQAIATARRLGAIVRAYDVRPEVKEQVESLGAKFIELELEAASGEGGYAKEMSEDFYKKQREMMRGVLAESDVVITTAAIPGKRSPVLITRDMLDGMQAGSVILDVAAERGGNCEVTRPDEVVDYNGVKIYGPTNLAATVPYHASQVYSRNLFNLLGLFLKGVEGIEFDMEDEIIKGVVVCKEGKIINEQVLKKLSG